MKAILVINEQHSVLPEQEKILGGYEKVYQWPIPAAGLSRQEQKALAKKLVAGMLRGDQVIFLSPVPAIMLQVAWAAGMYTQEGRGGEYRPLVFANDRREKKELPNGKVISITAKEGWYLA